jgi:uncharacterized membrane protein (UPF0127 family)
MIKNKTKQTIICKNKKLLTSVLSKAIGLMFSKRIKDLGLIFIFNHPQKNNLHMFFVFFPIDVLFLDNDKKVVELKENFRPFSYYMPRNNSVYVLELPAGTITKSKTNIKDIIEF